MYSYDYGDGWEAKVSYVGSDEQPYLECVGCEGGLGDAPPEDCGGPWGYLHFLEVAANPQDPEHESMVSWAEEQGFAPFDQEDVDMGLKGQFLDI